MLKGPVLGTGISTIIEPDSPRTDRGDLGSLTSSDLGHLEARFRADLDRHDKTEIADGNAGKRASRKAEPAR